MTAVANSARDLRYGRRGGRWAEGWTDDDEARYQAAKLAAERNAASDDDQPGLFDLEDADS